MADFGTAQQSRDLIPLKMTAIHFRNWHNAPTVKPLVSASHRPEVARVGFKDVKRKEPIRKRIVGYRMPGITPLPKEDEPAAKAIF